MVAQITYQVLYTILKWVSFAVYSHRLLAAFSSYIRVSKSKLKIFEFVLNLLIFQNVSICLTAQYALNRNKLASTEFTNYSESKSVVGFPGHENEMDTSRNMAGAFLENEFPGNEYAQLSIENIKMTNSLFRKL